MPGLRRPLLPSATLGRYVQAATLVGVGLVAMALTGLFSLLEFVEQLASVGQGRYHVSGALLYVLLSAPTRLLQVLPVATLMGVLLALGTLGRHSELVAMLSMGMPERRIIRAVLWLILPLSVLAFLMFDLVVPPARQFAIAERKAAIYSLQPGGTDNLWANSGGRFLHVQHLDGMRAASGIDVYAFTPDGTLRQLIGAQSAAIGADGVWQLHGVTRRTVVASQFRTERMAVLPWHSFISAKQLRFTSLPVDSLATVALWRHIQRGERLHQPTPDYQQELWRRLAIPLSMAAMVMMAVPLAFGFGRSGGAGRDLARGVGIGIAFTLGQQLATWLGALAGVDYALAAMAPGLLVAVLAVGFFPDAYWRGLRVEAGEERRVERALAAHEPGEQGG